MYVVSADASEAARPSARVSPCRRPVRMGPPENPNAGDPPEIVTVREQLGLELRAAQGPVSYLVIVSADLPQLDE
jgi:hypothetical protein